MKISDMLKKRKTLSFEIFPPKKDSTDIQSLYETIDKLVDLNPDFISVTYGAMGSTTKNTVLMANYIKNSAHTEALAHLTSISTPKEEIINICQTLRENSVENIMALRGDFPIGFSGKPVFEHASELNYFIKENFGDYFTLGGGCYPEVHVDCENLFVDLENLKKKQDSGAEFFITQVFFDNNYFYRFIKEARKMGITVPIIAGVMPITSVKQIRRMATMCGTSVPVSLCSMLERFRDNPLAMLEIGISYATNQIIDLLANDVDGIHIYTMNKPEVTKKICQNISEVIKGVRS